VENYLEYSAENTAQTLKFFCLCSMTHKIQIDIYSVSVILGFLGLLLSALLQDLLSQFTYNTYSIRRGTIYAFSNF